MASSLQQHRQVHTGKDPCLDPAENKLSKPLRSEQNWRQEYLQLQQRRTDASARLTELRRCTEIHKNLTQICLIQSQGGDKSPGKMKGSRRRESGEIHPREGKTKEKKTSRGNARNKQQSLKVVSWWLTCSHTTRCAARLSTARTHETRRLTMTSRQYCGQLSYVCWIFSTIQLLLLHNNTQGYIVFITSKQNNSISLKTESRHKKQKLLYTKGHDSWDDSSLRRHRDQHDSKQWWHAQVETRWSCNKVVLYWILCVILVLKLWTDPLMLTLSWTVRLAQIKWFYPVFVQAPSRWTGPFLRSPSSTHRDRVLGLLSLTM